MSMTIGKKLGAGFAAVIALTVVASGVCLVGLRSLQHSRDELSRCSRDSALASRLQPLAARQYQCQADLVINRDVKAIDDYAVVRAEMDKVNREADSLMDTEEEKAWMAALDQADSAFDAVFREKIVPEVRHEMEGVIGKYDAESDELLVRSQEAAQRIEACIRAKLDKAMAGADAEATRKCTDQLLAAREMMFWMVKQYQCQADLIINRNLAAVEDFDKAASLMDKCKAVAAAGLETAEEKALLTGLDESDAKFDGVMREKIVPEMKRVLEHRLRVYDGESDKHLAVVSDCASRVAASLEEEAQEASAEFDRVQGLVTWVVWVLGGVCVVLGSATAVLLTRSLTRSLGRVIARLRDGSMQVAAASGQVAQASQQMAAGASEQASSLEEVSSSLEEMASMTRQNADSAGQANVTAGEARAAAEQGNAAMGRMGEAIEKIKSSSDQTAKIVKTIDEIAFQTNLLALNAAVEAARAGEAGKGFAVVAEEVRNLAQRSAEAARTTAGLIEESQKNAEHGVAVSGEVGQILGRVAANVDKVGELIGQVTAASQEQSQGVEQINTAVAQMDKVTQSNAANAEESASASEELSAQARELNEMVGTLVGIVGEAAAAGNAGGAARSAGAGKEVGDGLDGLLHAAWEGGAAETTAAAATTDQEKRQRLRG